MLMSGNMSVGVRMRTTGVTRITTSAITTNVYGLDKANRTIHISRNVTLNSTNAPRLCRHPERLEHEFGLPLLDYRRPSFRYTPEDGAARRSAAANRPHWYFKPSKI